MASLPTESGFCAVCTIDALIAATSGALMMLFLNDIAVFGHGKEIAARILHGSTPHDQLLIRTSDSLAGLLLFQIGFLLFMVAFVKDRDFQAFFAKGCMLMHAAMGLWRLRVERRTFHGKVA